MDPLKSSPQLREGVRVLLHHEETVLTLTKALNLTTYGSSAKQGIDPPGYIVTEPLHSIRCKQGIIHIIYILGLQSI